MLSHFVRKLSALVGPRRAAPSVRADGHVWQLAPGAADVLGTDAPDVTRWAAEGRVEVVKQNLQRTIGRATLPGGVVYVKRCRANTPRAWCREVLRPAKARLEYENALTLRRLGLPAVEPVACGTTPGPFPGESVLITRALDRSGSFLSLLEEMLPALPPHDARAVRRQVARTLAAFLAKLHDAGVSHPDPHPGNLLVELPPCRVPRFALTDLHAVRFGPTLTWDETRENLVLMNRWFQLRAGRADRARFWRAYLAARGTLPVTHSESAAMARQLEADTAASNLRFWANRVGRYQSNNREYRRVKAGAVRGFAVRDLPDAVLRGWLADPDAAFDRPTGKVLKDSPSSTVVAATIPTPAGPRAVVLKRFRSKGWTTAVKNLLRPSSAIRSWRLGHGLRDRGLPTARPLAAFHRHRFGLPVEGYVAFETVADAPGLADAVADLENTPAGREWAATLGRLIRTMHDRRVSHRDLKAANVLMAGAESHPVTAFPVLIDLVGVRTDVPVPRATQVRDLARLNASFLHSPHVTRADRLRVLRAYLRWGLHGRGDWKAWWADVRRATAAKAAKNVRSGRALS